MSLKQLLSAAQENKRRFYALTSQPPPTQSSSLFDDCGDLQKDLTQSQRDCNARYMGSKTPKVMYKILDGVSRLVMPLVMY